jgi:hypothetical protein
MAYTANRALVAVGLLPVGREELHEICFRILLTTPEALHRAAACPSGWTLEVFLNSLAVCEDACG